MGKKKSAGTSDAAKVSRDWSASAISNRDINKLRSLGFISASEEDIRLPGAVTRPKPPKGFTVMFVAFLFRGLSLPAHEFLRSLLFFYGIQLWQLTPNSILHLSIFITVCETFLGIDPHWGLWRKIFYVKRHNDSNGPPRRRWRWLCCQAGDLDYPMKESVQGWRNKWFYLRDPAVSGQRSNLPPFEDKLVAKPKKSWQNALSPEERVIADKLFDQVVALKNTGGLTMCGTEVVSVFLQRRVQPLMSRPHQLWLYTGKDDESRVSSADLSAEDLRDEVRRLTCLSAKDNIVLTSARPPYDSQHLPTEVPALAQCYPPILESGVEPEDDDDNSEETEDAQRTLEDSDVREEEATEDDAFLRSRRRKQINEDFITTAESSPNRHDNDAAGAAPLMRVNLARQADDPWYIAYQDESTQWCSQRMDLEEKVANLGDELARKNLMIFELKRIVEEEKKNSELIRKEKLRVETDLAVFDQVVENLEHELKVMGEEKSRFICAVLLGVIPVLAVMWFW
ncbi:hypothetical protein QYE76_007915 [Lolium multiflorum]|uniref:Transposase (putative) gypsy type domain-containing protein n=1 Tax=Lolium multiflorum TaxID=4521 RepID=A0AAD8PIW3_LOLMU|nr:hypothetical protein QYE76_007915 [Lolium multiflorum]